MPGLPAVLAALSLAAAAAAPAAQPIDGSVITDGATRTAILTPDAVRVVRDAEPLEGGVSQPTAGLCGQPQAVGAIGVLLACKENLALGPVLLDPATGAQRPLLPNSALGRYTRANRANNQAYFITGIGRRLLRVSSSGNHVAGHVLVGLDDGRVRKSIPLREDIVESLDRDAGWRRLCRPLRIPLHGGFGAFGDSLGQPPAVTVGDWLLRVRRDGRPVLQRCGRAPIVLAGPLPTGQLALTTRWAAWSTTRNVEVRLLASGRRLRYPLRAPKGGYPYGFLAGTERRLYITDARGTRGVDLGA